MQPGKLERRIAAQQDSASARVVAVGVQREHVVLEKNLQKAVLENQRLLDVKAKYEASKKKADMYERRVRVIDELKAAQSGPVDLLNLVADTVNGTDAVWLETMTNDGKTLNFTGMALSPNSVADLMANLRKTGAFKTVEIKFELMCEMNPGFKKPQKQQS